MVGVGCREMGVAMAEAFRRGGCRVDETVEPGARPGIAATSRSYRRGDRSYGRGDCGCKLSGAKAAVAGRTCTRCRMEGTAVEPGESAERVTLTVEARGVAVRPTPRLTEVCLRFGVPLTGAGLTVASDLAVSLRPGTVTLIVGPSGSGKTLLIHEIAKRFPTARVVGSVEVPTDVAVLDAVAPTRPVGEAMSLLTACGLGEAASWTRSFEALSEGERFRARLARAISLRHRGEGQSLILCDEFGSLLHTRLAKAVAFNLRKLASRDRLAMVLATSRDDIERDLHPDSVIRLGNRKAIVETTPRSPCLTGEQEPRSSQARLSLADELRVVPGALRDYEEFAAMHYRQREQVGFVSSVFVLQHAASNESLGVVVYGHPMLELALRNKATGGRYVRQAELLNREVRVLKRLVIHPDVRGCGLGHELVRQTLPMPGARFVECLAAMGAVNPVFEKAGMRAVGVCRGSAGSEAALAWLRAAGADPLAADFTMQVRCRPAVRRVVAREVAGWYRATTGGGEDRVQRQTATFLAQTYRQLAGSQPVYFIWAATGGDWEFIEGNLAGLQIADSRLQIPAREAGITSRVGAGRLCVV